jgi:predicted amidohydrolase
MSETLPQETAAAAGHAAGVSVLSVRLQELAAGDVARDALRPDVLAVATETLAASREEIRARFLACELNGT